MTINESLIREIVQRIVSVAQPERIILFGSASTGQMTKDSDIDLLVLERDPQDNRGKRLRIRQALKDIGHSFDVMSDLFHANVPDDYICAVARTMVRADWHTYQVLTKRAERMAALLQTKLRFAAERLHIWWGVSVENRQHGLPRIDHLR